MSENQKLGAGECTADQGSKLLKMTVQHFNVLKRQGIFKPVRKGVYRVVEIVHAYIDYLQDENRKSKKTAAASRVQDMRAQEIEWRMQKERRDFIPADEVCDFLTMACGAFRSELAGVAAASSRDPEVRAEIEKNLDGAIERVSRTFLHVDGNVRSRRPLVLEAEEADAA